MVWLNLRFTVAQLNSNPEPEFVSPA